MRKSVEIGQGRLALITGASSGIGAVTARKLAREGLRVILAARRVERLQSLADEITQAGGEAHLLPADLAQTDERKRVFETVNNQYGALDVLVNNAGIGWYGYYEDMNLLTVQEMVQVNIAATAELTCLFLPVMKERHRGHIINVGSIAGGMPNQGVTLYSATKSFMDAFTTSLYRELKGSGVHVSVVRPGPVVTEFFERAAKSTAGGRIPAERFAIPAQAVADSIWSLLQRPRKVAYVPWGLSITPWIEITFGWLIDRLGPLLLRRKAAEPSISGVNIHRR
jgi:short-subunit dehydrogenase